MGVHLKDLNFYVRFQQEWRFPRLTSEERTSKFSREEEVLVAVCLLCLCRPHELITLEAVNWKLISSHPFQAFSFSFGDYLLHGSQAKCSLLLH